MSCESMPPIWWSPKNSAVAYTEWDGRIHEMEVNDGHIVVLPADAIRLVPAATTAPPVATCAHCGRGTTT